MLWLVICLFGVYLAGRSLYGRAYDTRHYFGDLALTALLIVAGFGVALLVLTLVP